MPARQGKPPEKQPKDPYAAAGKALASQVQRLRGWVGTDAGRRPELVDTLNALVAHRLAGHAYGAAGADAQDAVKQSADLLLASGPVGPYSSAVDAVRCGTALVQLAALQVAVGLVDAAGATLASWDGLRAQVVEAGTRVELGAGAGRHALLVASRVALGAGDVATANAYADAALAVPADGADEGGFGAVDLDRAASDGRWAAGRTEQSLGFLHSAKEAYERVVGDRLAEPGRLGPPLAERLAEPLPGLYRDLADRLGAVGELDLALANRRLLVERLRALAPRSEALRPALASALTDLAADLLLAERAEEALTAASEAQAVAAERVVPAPTRLLAAAALARASARCGQPSPAAPLRARLAADGSVAGPAVRGVVSAVLADLLRAEGLPEAAAAAASAEAQAAEAGVVLLDRVRGVVSRGDGTVSWEPLLPTRAYGAPLAAGGAEAGALVPTWLEQERAEARRQESVRADEARREAEQREVEAVRAERARAEAEAARTAAEQEARAREEAHRREAEEADQAERKRRREERLQQHQAEVDARERAQRASRRDEIDARLAELDAAEEQERDRLLAERAGLDDADAPADVGPTGSSREHAAPEPEIEPEQVGVAEVEPADEPERVAEVEPAAEPEVTPSPVVSPEPMAAPEPAAEPVAAPAPEPAVADDLEVAEQALADARAGGGRREVRAAAETVVVVLRERSAQDPAAYGDRLRAALEDLSSARFRSGDLFGARAATREAKTLR